MEPQSLNQMLTVMEEQTKIMSDLIALSRKKSEALVESKLEELDLLLRGEQALIWQMGRLEERRFQLQVEVARQLNLHPSQLTLERLLQSVPSDFQQKCQTVAEQYGASARELSEVNQLNTELIQQSMAFVDFSLQLLGARGPAAAQVYSPRGHRNGQDGKLRRLDNRV